MKESAQSQASSSSATPLTLAGDPRCRPRMTVTHSRKLTLARLSSELSLSNMAVVQRRQAHCRHHLLTLLLTIVGTSKYLHSACLICKYRRPVTLDDLDLQLNMAARPSSVNEYEQKRLDRIAANQAKLGACHASTCPGKSLLQQNLLFELDAPRLCTVAGLRVLHAVNDANLMQDQLAYRSKKLCWRRPYSLLGALQNLKQQRCRFAHIRHHQTAET